VLTEILLGSYLFHAAKIIKSKKVKK